MPRPFNLPARLGWVSFFNDASSEVLGRVLPLYLVLLSGAPPVFVGIIEGLADGGAILLKGLSGWLSDHSRTRKPYVVAGYGLSVAARAAYLLSLAPWSLGLARVLDRVGKGLRSAPRDAMVADAAAKGTAGRAFGITRFLDTLGSMAGVSLVLLLGLGHGPMTESFFRQCAWLALPLGLAALALLAFFIPAVPRAITVPRRLAWHVPHEIRGFLAWVVFFGLANSSDAFLVLRAKEAGFSIRGILVLFLVFNGLAAALAIPAGRLSDRMGRLPFLVTGWTVYGLSYLVMAMASGPFAFAGALLAYGAFYGLTEGVEKALLADLLLPEHRGTGFGAFQTANGIAALIASPLMGLWIGWFGMTRALLVSGSMALLAALGLVLWGWRRNQPRPSL